MSSVAPAAIGFSSTRNGSRHVADGENKFNNALIWMSRVTYVMRRRGQMVRECNVETVAHGVPTRHNMRIVHGPLTIPPIAKVDPIARRYQNVVVSQRLGTGVALWRGVKSTQNEYSSSDAGAA